jgi:hypothetical protein
VTHGDVGVAEAVVPLKLHVHLLLVARHELYELLHDHDRHRKEDDDAHEQDHRLEHHVLCARVPVEAVQAGQRADVHDPLAHVQLKPALGIPGTRLVVAMADAAHAATGHAERRKERTLQIKLFRFQKLT